MSHTSQTQSGATGVPARDRFIGAPQVLEIPIQDGQNGREEQNEQTLQEQAIEQQELQSESPPLSAAQQTYQQTYLGLRYATADECLYLELAEERPAADHACFSPDHNGDDGDDSKNSLQTQPEGVKVLSVIPLAMAYDVYTSRHTPGDLIIAVDGESVHTAQEFNALMNRYQPGAAVTFSVMRKGEPLRLTAQLEAEPLLVE
jgi:C-terminal processing protease CtpA/Prc